MKFRKKRHKIKKIFQITLIAIAGLILIAGLTVYLLLHNYIQKMNLVDSDVSDKNTLQTEAADRISDNTHAADNEAAPAASDHIEKPIEASGTMSTGNDKEAESEESSTDYYSQASTITSESQTAYNPYSSQIKNQEEQQSKNTLSGNEQPNNRQDEANLQEQAPEADEYSPVDIPIMEDSQVINLLLIGSDTKSKEEGASCDSIVVFTVNRNTKKIITTTLLYNSYIQIPGEGKNRLSEAYQIGGANLLAAAVEQNFRINIDHYIMADYLTFIDIVDTVGGITVEVEENELEPVNGNLKDINEQLGDAPDSDLLQEEKTYLFNGKQALAYSRSWYSKKGDFLRTGKQKEIILSIYDKIKQFNFIELNGFLNRILPQITTNFTEKEILEQFIMMPAYFSYDLEQWTVPVEDSYKKIKKDGKSVLELDYELNIAKLQQKLYNGN